MVSEEMLIPFYLWIGFIIFNYLLGGLMVRKTFKTDMAITRRYFIGADLLLFIHATCRIFYFIYDFYYPNQQIWWNIGAFLGLLSVECLMAAIESTFFKKSKYTFTIIGALGLVLMGLDLFFDFGIDLGQIVQYSVVTILAIVILLIYVYMTIKSTGEIRKTSFIMVIGVLLFEVGQVAHTSAAAQMFPWTIYVTPFIMIAALVFLYISVSRFYSE